jgi:hypothetical protein
MLTIKDTKHISEEDIQRDIDMGEISFDLAAQEYHCSFDMGIDGSVYGKTLDIMRHKGQIGIVPWQPNHKVHTAWDIGIEGTAIIFYQCIGQTVNIIESYEKSGEQLEFYVNYINSKPYTYGKHFFPHDMNHKEFSGKKFTRLEKARQLGVKGEIVDSVGLEDGIEYTKSAMARMYIDEKNAASLIISLENYRYEWDRKNSRYKSIPLHNKYSHTADALRYTALSLPKSSDSLTQADIDRQRAQALYANQSSLPPFFQDSQPWRNEPHGFGNGFR